MPARAEESRHKDRLRILVVEDEFLVAFTMMSALEEAGHIVRGPARTMGQALDLAEFYGVDLALVDINLGSGGSGVATARALRQRWNITSIFVTGFSEEGQQGRDTALGLIRKPSAGTLIVESVDYARALMSGADEATAPSGLELFAA